MLQAASFEIRGGQIDAIYAFARAPPRPPSIDCECSLLGSEMPDNALPAVPAPSELSDVAERQDSHKALFMVQHG
jgi:hypothetical protein